MVTGNNSITVSSNGKQEADPPLLGANRVSPIHNDPAERRLLGMVMLLGHIPDGFDLEPNDFGLYRHHLIASAIQNHKRRGEEFGPDTVKDEMIKLGTWDMVSQGDDNCLNWMTDNLDSRTKWQTDMETVRECSRQRKTVTLGEKIATAGFQGNRAAAKFFKDELGTLLGDDETGAPAATKLFAHADTLNNLPPLEWLIPDTIPAKAYGMVSAPPNTGKSYLLNTWAMQIAQRDAVLYCLEEGFDEMQNRRKAYAQFFKVGSGALYYYHPDELEDGTIPKINLFTGENVPALIAFAQQVKAKLIIIDPYRDFVLGSVENSNDDAGVIKARVRQIIRATGATVLVAHHTNKEGNGYSGAGAIMGAVDFAYDLSSDGDVLTLEINKARDFDKRTIDPRAYRTVAVTLPDGATNQVLMPANRVVQTVFDKLPTLQRSILEALAMAVFDQGARVNDLMQYLPTVAKREIYRASNKLIELGFAKKDGRFDPYVITEAGKRKVSQSTKPDDNTVSQGFSEVSQDFSRDSFSVSQVCHTPLGVTNGENNANRENGKSHAMPVVELKAYQKAAKVELTSSITDDDLYRLYAYVPKDRRDCFEETIGWQLIPRLYDLLEQRGEPTLRTLDFSAFNEGRVGS